MVEVDLIGAAIEHATKSAGLRAAALKLADAAEFHAAVSRAFLRDFAAAHVQNDGDEP